MDGILVQLGIHEADLDAGDLLGGEGSPGHGLVEGLLDELHGLVQVLDTLGAVDQHVVVVEGDNALRLDIAHSEVLQLLGQGLGVLDLRVDVDLVLADGVLHRVLERTDDEVELVVLVGRFTLELVGVGSLDGLLVHDDGRGGDDVDSLLVDDPVLGDLQVELSHTGHQVLAGLVVDLDVQRGVGLGDDPQDLDQLGQVGHVLGLDGLRDDGLGVVSHPLVGLHVLDGGHGASGDGVLESGQGDDVSGLTLLDGGPVGTDHESDGLNPLGVGLSGDVEGLTLPHGTGEQPSDGDLSGLLVHDDLGDHHGDLSVGVAVKHVLSERGVEVSLPDGGDTDLLGIHGVGDVVDGHLEDDVGDRDDLGQLLLSTLLGAELEDGVQVEGLVLELGCELGSDLDGLLGDRPGG